MFLSISGQKRETTDTLPSVFSSETRAYSVLGVEVPLAFIAVLVVLLRLHCRGFLGNKVTADDVFIGLSMLISFGMSVLNVLSLLYGTGFHITNCTSGWIRITGEFGAASQALFGISMTMTKISVLIFYRRCFQERSPQLLCNLGLAFVFSWGIADVLMNPSFCLSPL